MDGVREEMREGRGGKERRRGCMDGWREGRRGQE